jgi:cytochrome c553
MQMIATELSPAQINAIADTYAAMPRRSTDPANGAPVTAGQQIALVGLRAAGLGPCAECHGVTRAADKAYPVLEGQSRWYLANQLEVFRNGGRGRIGGDRTPDPMVAIARKLTDAQIRDVAAYYAAQPPAQVQSFAAVEHPQ